MLSGQRSLSDITLSLLNYLAFIFPATPSTFVLFLSRAGFTIIK
jgi:hypothetical protein